MSILQAHTSTRRRLRLDWTRRRLIVDGRELHVTPLECRLIAALVQCQGVGLPEEEVMAVVWGRGHPQPALYLRKLVRQVRQKIERDPRRPMHLLGVPGGTYRLELG